MSATITKLTPSSLSALLCARICHDLISPVGALSTAIEILDDESNSDMHDDALNLVRNSSKQANAKLKFLRLAFGAGGSAPGIISVKEIQTLSQDMFAQGKASLLWQISDVGIDKSQARLLLNMIMIGMQAVPRGGEVVISQANRSDGATELTIAATGPRARLELAVERTLIGKAPEDGFDGRSIQPFYTGMMAREIGGNVSAVLDNETVTVTALLPQPAPASANQSA
ncbi:MAG: histidine phosphotransferase family protein [Litorimonas sp.]